jgi:hypothetical protein
MPDDIKLRRFTPQEKWAWVVLLCLASKSGDRGTILADDDDIADYCEFNSTQDWLYYRDKLIAKGMLEITPNGSLSILHWSDRQYDNPSSKPEATRERKRRQRARQKDLSPADVTTMSRDVTTSHATDTDTDTDPDPEVTSNSLVSLKGTEIADAIAREKNAPLQNEFSIETRTEAAETATDSPLSKKGRSHSAQPTVKGKVSAAPRLENLKTEEVYDRVAHRQTFEDFWVWYCKQCKVRSANPGSKKQAAIAWINTLEVGDFEKNMERFRDGCRAFNWDAVGIPHAVLFLRGSRTDGRQPYWEAALEQQAAIASTDSLESSALSLPTNAAPASLAESLATAPPETHPWCRDASHLMGFVEYLVNTGDRRKGEQERRQIVIGMIRKGNAAMTGAIEHQRVLQSWFLFLDNAQKSQTLQQATGADKMPPHLREFFASRDKARAEAS